MDKYQEHVRKKRECPFLERTFGSDWVTCTDPDNPTAFQVCTSEHCPRKDQL